MENTVKNSEVILVNGLMVAQVGFDGVPTGVNGKIEIRDGLPKVLFEIEGQKKITDYKPERWQVMETTNGKAKKGAKESKAQTAPVKESKSIDILDAAILETESKQKAKSAKAEKAEKEVETLSELTAEEFALREKLEREFFAKQKAEKNLTAKIEKQVAELNLVPFELARIAYELQSKKLYRSTHTNFKAYAVEVLKVKNAQYVFQLARVGNFVELQKQFVSENGLSFRAADSFINNSKAVGAKFGQPESELSDRNDYLTEVLEITRAASEKDSGDVKISPVTIEQTNAAIVEELENVKFDVAGDIFAQAAERLQASRDKVINNAKFNIENVGKFEVCNHIQTIRSIENDIITLECGCTFKRFEAKK